MSHYHELPGLTSSCAAGQAHTQALFLLLLPQQVGERDGVSHFAARYADARSLLLNISKRNDFCAHRVKMTKSRAPAAIAKRHSGTEFTACTALGP